MDRAGEKASPLSADELEVIFKAVAHGGAQKKARQCLSGRDRNTVNRACNVVAEFERRGATDLKDNTAAEIAEAARYSTTISYVQDLFLKWRAWKEPSLPTSSRNSAQLTNVSKLKMEFDHLSPDNLGFFAFLMELGRRFARVTVRRVSGPIAERCWGVLRVLRTPSDMTPPMREFRLHWADTDYTLESDTAETVSIETRRHLDVVFSLPPGWPGRADRLHFQKGITSGETYGIRGAGGHGPALAPRFVGPGTAATRMPPAPMGPLYAMQEPWDEVQVPQEGCWVAMPLALSQPHLATQAYLPPGEYLVSVEVGCGNGVGDSACFKITSPRSWKDLRTESAVSP